VTKARQNIFLFKWNGRTLGSISAR